VHAVGKRAKAEALLRGQIEHLRDKELGVVEGVVIYLVDIVIGDILIRGACDGVMVLKQADLAGKLETPLTLSCEINKVGRIKLEPIKRVECVREVIIRGELSDLKLAIGTAGIVAGPETVLVDLFHREKVICEDLERETLLSQLSLNYGCKIGGS
jgi:hypothetical protein